MSEHPLCRPAGDFSVVEKFLDDSERLYGEPHPSRCCVRSARRIVVKARARLLSA